MKKKSVKQKPEGKKTALKPMLVNFILDETGSMGSVLDATISGFNEYIESLKSKGGQFLLTLTQFNTEKIHSPYVRASLDAVSKLTHENYRPAACTPLYDAIGRSIQEIDQEKNVLCVIMTDGQENSSKEYGRGAISRLIKEKEKEGWTFVYLGADHDAWAEASFIGMAAGNTMNYNKNKTKKTFAKLATATEKRSRNLAAGQSATVSFYEDAEIKEEDIN